MPPLISLFVCNVTDMYIFMRLSTGEINNKQVQATMIHNRERQRILTFAWDRMTCKNENHILILLTDIAI